MLRLKSVVPEVAILNYFFLFAIPPPRFFHTAATLLMTDFFLAIPPDLSPIAISFLGDIIPPPIF
jgi:hypothetical protein